MSVNRLFKLKVFLFCSVRYFNVNEALEGVVCKVDMKIVGEEKKNRKSVKGTRRNRDCGWKK